MPESESKHSFNVIKIELRTTQRIQRKNWLFSKSFIKADIHLTFDSLNPFLESLIPPLHRLITTGSRSGTRSGIITGIGVVLGAGNAGVAFFGLTIGIFTTSSTSASVPTLSPFQQAFRMEITATETATLTMIIISSFTVPFIIVLIPNPDTESPNHKNNPEVFRLGFLLLHIFP